MNVLRGCNLPNSLASVVLGAMIALAGILPATAQTNTDPAPLVASVRSILADETRLALPIEKHRDDLIRYYGSDDAMPLFVGTDRPRGLVVRMIDADFDGLDPDYYAIEYLEDLAEEIETASPERLAEIETWFASHFLLLAADIKVGRVLPRMVYPDLYMPRKVIDGENVLRALSHFSDMDGFFTAWEPYNPEYTLLKTALADYVEIGNQGGWGQIPAGPDVDPGGRDPRVPALRLRLDIETGYEPPRGDADVLDQALSKRLREFQFRHAIPVTGSLDKATLLALNVTVERRIEQITLSMERLRWMPEELSDRILIANKGDGLLRLFEQGQTAREWRILPNCPRDNLAVVAGQMQTMVLNPNWEVPFDYFQSHLFPVLQSEPASVEQQGYELLYRNVDTPIGSLPWKSFPRASLSNQKDDFRFRLGPGATNPYGRFVYRLDGIDEAYLFDAPAAAGQEVCDPRLSKGAIAVVDGLDLIKLLIQRRLGPDDYLERTLSRKETLIVPDVDRLPLMIVFQSAWIDANGQVRFSKDPNLEDQRLIEALKGKEKA